MNGWDPIKNKKTEYQMCAICGIETYCVSSDGVEDIDELDYKVSLCNHCYGKYKPDDNCGTSMRCSTCKHNTKVSAF